MRELTQGIWLFRASSSLLSGRSEVPCGEVEGVESQHMEEVLTLVWREGKLGRGPLGRGEKMQERAGCWEHLARTQLCFSPQGVCSEMQGHRASPAWSCPCCSAQKPLPLLFSCSECCLQGLGIRALGPHATAHRARGSGIPGGKISGLVRVFPLQPAPCPSEQPPGSSEL